MAKSPERIEKEQQYHNDEIERHLLLDDSKRQRTAIQYHQRALLRLDGEIAKNVVRSKRRIAKGKRRRRGWVVKSPFKKIKISAVVRHPDGSIKAVHENLYTAYGNPIVQFGYEQLMKVKKSLIIIKREHKHHGNSNN